METASVGSQLSFAVHASMAARAARAAREAFSQETILPQWIRQNDVCSFVATLMETIEHTTVSRVAALSLAAVRPGGPEAALALPSAYCIMVAHIL